MGRHLETIQSGHLRWLTYDQLIVLMHSFSYLVNGRAGLIAQLVALEFFVQQKHYKQNSSSTLINFGFRGVAVKKEIYETRFCLSTRLPPYPDLGYYGLLSLGS